MTQIDEFFQNVWGVKLDRPIHAHLRSPSGVAPGEATAIIVPKLDQRKNIVIDFYDLELERRLPGSYPLAPSEMESVTVQLPRVGEIQTKYLSILPLMDLSFTDSKEGRLYVSQKEFTVSDCELASAVFCITDFPRFMGPGAMEYVEIHPMMQGIGHIEIESDGWVITIREFTESDSDFGVTHNGLIKRVDADNFSVNELRHLINGLTYFFSFVTGVYREPTVVIAHGEECRNVWGRLGSIRQPEYRTGNWFHRTNGSSLVEIFPGFWNCFKSDEEKVKTVVGHYSESSMIAHIGLHNNALVTSRSALQGAAKWKLNKNGVSSKETEDALNEFGIQYDANSLIDITNARNEITHADFFATDYQRYYDLWNLCQKYVELMLFKFFDYHGEYRDRVDGSVVEKP